MPFNFDLSARIFTDGDPQIRKYENGRFWQVLKYDKNLVLITVESSGEVENPELVVEVKSKEEITSKNLKSISNMIIKIFNLDMDLIHFIWGLHLMM